MAINGLFDISIPAYYGSNLIGLETQQNSTLFDNIIRRIISCFENIEEDFFRCSIIFFQSIHRFMW